MLGEMLTAQFKHATLQGVPLSAFPFRFLEALGLILHPFYTSVTPLTLIWLVLLNHLGTSENLTVRYLNMDFEMEL